MFSVVNNQFYSYFKLYCQVENKYFSVKCKSDSNKRHDYYYPASNNSIRFFTKKPHNTFACINEPIIFLISEKLIQSEPPLN